MAVPPQEYVSKTRRDDMDTGDMNMTKVISWAPYARSFSHARLLDKGFMLAGEIAGNGLD